MKNAQLTKLIEKVQESMAKSKYLIHFGI